MKGFVNKIIPLVVSLALLLSVIAPLSALAAPYPPPQSETNEAVEQAVLQRLSLMQKGLLNYEGWGYAIDHSEVSADGLSAVVWLARLDENGEVLASEPTLTIATRAAVENAAWDVTLPTDAEYSARLQALPDTLLPADSKTLLTSPSLDAELTSIYRGYKLPWAAPLVKRLTGSIWHIMPGGSCPTACRYAYDFADGTMFPLLAAKGGTVYAYDDHCTNGSETCTNYLILEDRSTVPTTWQIYFHLAQYSIPANLRSNGAPVLQGQYIGNVDDTGYSTGHHLHFHVTAGIYSYTTYYGQKVYWGNSVDIRFDDVAINDGTPRTCYEAATWPEYGTECQDSYTSGNIGSNPPGGNITAPANALSITDGLMTVSGQAWDDLAVTKVVTIIRPAGSDRWTEIGPAMTAAPYTTTVDVCSANLPNGPVDVSIRAYDYEGNMTFTPQGVRTVVNNSNCPQPIPLVCAPDPTRVILYSEPNYQGDCQVYGAVDSPTSIGGLGGSAVGDNDAASMRVGSSVRAVLYSDANFTGRIETLQRDDPNLADNPLGANTLSSLTVQPVGSRITIPALIYPPVGTITSPALLPSNTSITFTFKSLNATRFGIQFMRVGDTVATTYMDIDRPVVSIGTLPAGDYQWRAFAANSMPSSDWGAWSYFRVPAYSPVTTSIQTVPFADSFETNTGAWTSTSGWGYKTLSGTESKGWGYLTTTTSGIVSGSLTSPDVSLPAGASYLRFKYNYKSEGTASFWDQRHVQISVNDGPFQDLQITDNLDAFHELPETKPTWLVRPPVLAPLWDDPAATWLQSPALNLSEYAGKKVKIRFYISSVDPLYNSGLTWEIDDFSITTTPPETSCAEVTSNDYPVLGVATPITIGSQSGSQKICPAGDVDVYSFSGSQDQEITIRVDAISLGSALDPVLSLLDQYGGLILENDDQVEYLVQDSAIHLTLPYTGTYFIKVRAWDHPSGGGTNHFYNLSLPVDSTSPSLEITTPATNWINGQPFDLTVEASDAGSGLARVDFYWHSSDWLNSSWKLIGSDWIGSDGWQININPADPIYSGMIGGALYAQAVDRTFNTWGQMRHGLRLDTTPPVSALTALATLIKSTAVQLFWSGSDEGSGIEYFEVQSDDGEGWSSLPAVPGKLRSAWFLGAPAPTRDGRRPRARGPDHRGGRRQRPDRRAVVRRPDADRGRSRADGRGAGSRVPELLPPRHHRRPALVGGGRGQQAGGVPGS